MLKRLLLLLLTALLASCATSGGGGNSQAEIARRAEIAAEPRGDYWVARRYHLDHTHFWGYVRRPGESWDKARLVVVNERFCKIPDRLPEAPSSGNAYGYNHNYQYLLWGDFSGRKVFDPNSNMVLPEFVLKDHKLVSANPGYLFKPNERFTGSLPRAEPGAMP